MLSIIFTVGILHFIAIIQQNKKIKNLPKVQGLSLDEDCEAKKQREKIVCDNK